MEKVKKTRRQRFLDVLEEGRGSVRDLVVPGALSKRLENTLGKGTIRSKVIGVPLYFGSVMLDLKVLSLCATYLDQLTDGYLSVLYR